MEIEAALYAELAADSSVSALVSSRIYPVLIPQDVDMPAIAYQRISGPRDYSHQGAGLVSARFQITCQATSYSGAKSLAAAVRDALSGFSGTMGAGGGGGGVKVQGAFVDNDLDGYGATAQEWTVRLDVIIQHTEA